MLGKQSSIREKARLQPLSLPQSGAWLSAAPIDALGHHLSSNEFCIALKNWLGVKMYENERKCPFCKSEILDVMPWLEWYDLLSWFFTRQNYFSLLGSSFVSHLWTEKFTPRQKLQTGRYLLTCIECQSASSFRRFRYFSLAAKPHYKCAGEKWFSNVSCWGQEVRTVRPEM